MSNKIYRSIGLISRNIDESSRRIEGRAIVFDSFSKNLRGFIEKIDRGAITQELLLSSDVVMNVDHKDERMLARYTKGQGTLSLELREDGLYFSFDAPDTQLGDEIFYHVRQGNYTECSFACLVSKDNIKRYKEGGEYVQVINKIDVLLDISIVVRGAYEETNVFARSEDEAKKEFEEIKKEVDEKEKEEVREKDCEKDKDKENVREKDCEKDKDKEDVREQDCNKKKEEKEEKDPEDPEDPEDPDDKDDKDDDEEEVKRALIINKLDEKLREFYKNI